MPTTNERPTIKRLKLSELRIDKRYQRPLNKAAVAKITTSFDPVLCGVIEVSTGVNGAYSVFDGQHRLAALQILGETEWPCRIHKLAPKEQAEKFVLTQTQRRPVNPLDRHKASLFAGDELAVKVNNLVDEAGFSIGQGKAFGQLSCVSALYESYEKYKAPALRAALGVIDETWGREDRLARKGPMVRGMTLLIAKYPEIKLDVLVTKLRAIPSAQIARGAAAEARIGGRGTTEWVLVARQLLEAYNAKRRYLTEEEIAAGEKPTRISPSKLGRDA